MSSVPDTQFGIFAVIPAYNEAGRIDAVVRAATEAGLHVLVVDDGSTDGTAEIAERAGAIDVIRHDSNRGYDAALATGLVIASRHANCRWVVTMDGDGQIDPADAHPLVAQAINSGAAVGCGIRGLIPRVSERLAARVVRPLTGLADPLCGLKAYRVDVIRRFETSAGRGVGMTLTLRALRAGEQVAQRGTDLAPRMNGTSRFGRGWLVEARILAALLGVLPIALGAARAGSNGR